MSYLKDLQPQIDAGRTAKHLIWRSILHILVRKELGFYAVQTESYTNPDGVIVVPVNTVFYPTWNMLLDSFKESYKDAEWWLCDEPFADYLPPKRIGKEIPE